MHDAIDHKVPEAPREALRIVLSSLLTKLGKRAGDSTDRQLTKRI